MHTANLTRTDAVKLLLAKPALRVRLSQSLNRRITWISRNRIEIALVTGIAFGSVFAVLSGVACTSSLY